MVVGCCIICTSQAADKQASYNKVVPLPREILLSEGRGFMIDGNCSIAFPDNMIDMQRNAGFLKDYVERATGISMALKPYIANKTKKAARIKGDGHTLWLTINAEIANDEGYRLTVNDRLVRIEGRTAQGVFYGIQTLRKSLPIILETERNDNSGVTNQVELPAVVINDQPRFAYRGMHLDVSRHFFGIDVVKEYLDIMALHNMNTFHWHITDDQGWRIEIKKYPKLAQLGSQRKHTVIGRNMGIYDDTPYGGYFTQDEAREVVQYAKDRYITVIPEVDMPGHMLGALKAYPELGCTGGPYETEGRWGVFEDILCAGNEQTYQFINDVLDELMDIFPSQIFHIGGDEAPRERWEKCPKCQQRIRELGLKGDGKYAAEAKLQGYFTNRVENYLISKGRRIIGWDEILEGDVNASAMIMSWRGVKGGLEAAEKGHDVVMAPTSHGYFDYYQTNPEDWNNPTLFKAYLPMERVYSLDPSPDSLSVVAKKHIIGAQANIWTEYIAYKNLLEYQMLPRAAAMCEVQWVMPKQKNYGEFLERERQMLKIYQLYNYTYCPAEFNNRKQ